jgi:hypothetical protein
MTHLRVAVGLVAAGVLLLTVFAAFVWLPLALLPPAIALIIAGGLYDVPRQPKPPR